MKRITTILSLLLVVCMGAWAEAVTWTPGLAFAESTAGNYSTGWFTVVSPINGTLSSFTVNLGTGGGSDVSRTDAYLAISRNLKSSTTGFSASDFVAISNESCTTSGSKITLTFNSDAVLNGGSTYYFYWVTESAGVYTTVNQRYYVVSSTQMSVGFVGSTSASSSSYAMPFSATMTIADNKYYRIKALYPDDICYLYSNASNENKIWKNTVAPSVTASRYVWKATISTGLILQNVGSSRYIPKLTTGSKTGAQVDYLTATTTDDAEKFSLEDNNPGTQNKPGFIALKSTTAASDVWLNTATSGNGYVGSHNANPNKSGQFLFYQVKKVTFSSPVAVNGGDAVSTIYVAVDGSDSFALPVANKYTIGGVTYYAAEAAEAIAAAGTSDISVTVSSALISSTTGLSNSKCYTIQTANSRGVAVASGGTQLASTHELDLVYDATDNKQQFAFIYYDADPGDEVAGKYYMYSVSEKKFIAAAGTGDGSAFNLSKLATQSVDFLASGVDGYPICIEMSNTADMNIRGDNNTPGIIVYGKGGTDKDNSGNAVKIIEVANFDPTVALSTWSTRDVTYELYYNNTKKKEHTVTGDHLGLAVIPSAIDNGFMAYTYTPSVITPETETVRIDATWNGPFQIADTYNASTAKWYTVGIHSAYEAANHIWKYESSNDKVITEAVATNDFGSVKNYHLFCFVGNPYDGFSIYNKAAGDSKTIYKADNQTDQAIMAATGSLFVPDPSTESGRTVANGYGCFKLKDGTWRLNADAGASYIIKGWSDSGNGSTCWFFPEGKYYLTYLNSLLLDPPAGSVGTNSYITTEELRTELINTRDALSANLFYLDSKTEVDKTLFKTKLTGVTRSSTITLTDGYYQIVSANPAFVEKTGIRRRIMYNETKLIWTNDMDTKKVHGIFKLEGTGETNQYNIKSPNAQSYLSNLGGVLGSATAVTITEAASGTAQYSLYMAEGHNGGHHYLHCNGHSSGNGTTDDLTAWNAGANSASAWYIVKVDDVDINLNDGGDGNYYATMCLPFDVTIKTISDANAYTLALDGTKNWLVPAAVADNKVPAGTPVLLKGSEATARVTINTGEAFNSGSPLSCALTGTYVDLALNGAGATDYFFGRYRETNDDPYVVGFYHWNGSTLKANRAYFHPEVSQGARGYAVMWDENETTGVNEVIGNMSEVTDGAIYDLQGRKVANPSRGLYIINGRKIVIK